MNGVNMFGNMILIYAIVRYYSDFFFVVDILLP